MSDVLDGLRALLGDGFFVDAERRVARGRDTWMRSEIDAWQGRPARPRAVAAPATTDEAAAVVRFCRDRRVPMVARGGGSGVVGGVLADADTVVVSTERMAGLRELADDDLLASFGAGTNGMDAEDAVRRAGLTIGHWPQSIEVSTVGGWVATRASGQYSTAYGNIEDVVLSLEAVLPDGSVYRSRDTPRASAGPDLRHLLIGSEGTLGLITEVTVSLRPLPEAGRRRAYHFADFDTGLEAVRRIIRAGWRPPVVRLYDEIEAERHFGEHLPAGHCMLILLHEGAPGLAVLESDAVADLCGDIGGTRAADEAVDQWFDARNTVPTWRELLEQGVLADTIEVAAPWSRLAGLRLELIEALRAVPGVIAASAHSSHAYRSGANLYLTVAAMPGDGTQFGDVYDAIWAAAMKTAVRRGAGLAHHHGIGRVRRPWLGDELGSAGLAMLRSVKRSLDPEGLWNPGVLADPT